MSRARRDLLPGFGNGGPEGSLTGGKCWEQVPERMRREPGGRRTHSSPRHQDERGRGGMAGGTGGPGRPLCQERDDRPPQLA